MEKKFLQLNDIQAYKISFELSNYVWNVVICWKFFEKDTVGKQFARSIDSISANIAEGFGRYTKKDKIHFYRIAYGSLTESSDWNKKSYQRKLCTKEQYDYIHQRLETLPREIHQLIKFTNEKLTI